MYTNNAYLNDQNNNLLHLTGFFHFCNVMKHFFFIVIQCQIICLFEIQICTLSTNTGQYHNCCILTMHQGKIVEMGTFEELMRFRMFEGPACGCEDPDRCYGIRPLSDRAGFKIKRREWTWQRLILFPDF